MDGRLAVGISVVWVALAFLGDGLTALVLPYALASMADPATTVGLISFAGLGLAMAVQPIAGRLSDSVRDRLDRRRFMLIAAIPAVVAIVALAAADALPLVAFAFLVAMVSGSLIQAAQQTLIPEHVPADRRGRAAGLKTAFDIGGAFVAFLLLGWALEAGGLAAAAAVISVVVGSAVVLAARLVPATPVADRQEIAVTSPAAAGFWTLVLSRFLFLFGIYVVGRFLLFLVADRLGIPAASAVSEAGGLLALFTLVTAVTALAIGPVVDRVGRRRAMGVGAAVAGSGTALFIVPGGLPVVIAAGCLMSIGTALYATGNWAALTDLSPPEDAGRSMGLANIGTGGAAACAGLLGVAIDTWGFAPTLVLATASVLSAIVPLALITGAARLEGSPT